MSGVFSSFYERVARPRYPNSTVRKMRAAKPCPKLCGRAFLLLACGGKGWGACAQHEPCLRVGVSLSQPPRDGLVLDAVFPAGCGKADQVKENVTMLKLTKKDGALVAPFENYQEALRYITDKENVKLLRNHPEFNQLSWGFLFLSPQKVAEAIHIARWGYDEDFFLDAWEQQVPIVAMCEGNPQNIHRQLIGRTANVDALREDWCKDYCTDHGMILS